jgi:hypothetical protein
MTHKHHSIPKSRGGTDEKWNLVELDPYTHAYEHALDFVLFEHAPNFDCRHDAWPLLPENLREVVRRELSVRMANRIVSEETKKKLAEANLGKKVSPETKQKMSASHKGKKASASHRESIKKALIGHPVSDKSRETARVTCQENFRDTNSLRFRCLVTGKTTTAGPLTGYQKSRGIDTSLRERVYE